MTRLKRLVQCALVTVSAPVVFQAHSAQAAGLFVDLGGVADASRNIVSFTVVDDFGTTATLSALIVSGQSRNMVLAGGRSFGGVAVNITNVSLTAPSGRSLTFTGGFSNMGPAGNPLLYATNRFSGVTFSSTVVAQSVLSGSFATGSGFVNTANLAGFQARTSFGTTVTTVDSGPLGSDLPSSGFKYTSGGFLSNASGVLNNPTLELLLGSTPTSDPTQVKPFFLAAGQTLSLPSSACYVVYDTVDTNGNLIDAQTFFDLTLNPATKGQAVEDACQRLVPPPPPEDVPEPSALLALLGMFGTAALLKRKPPFKLN